MKKWILSATSILLIAATGNAQIKVKDKAVISIPSVQLCDECKDQIEFFVSKSEGVISVKVDLKRKTATVAWLTDRTNKETIKTTIANMGYAALGLLSGQADGVAAIIIYLNQML